MNTSIEQISRNIRYAYDKARTKHKPMQSMHEGYAIILEEFEELWTEIKRYPKHDPSLVYKEALHTAAMLLAFIKETI